MSIQQLTSEAMALPIPERAALAEALWESIRKEAPELYEEEWLNESIRRDEEMSSGAVVGRTHEEVFQAVRRAISL